MPTVSSVLTGNGGIASRAVFDAAGVSARRLGAEVAAGRVIRVRRGWFASAGTDEAVIHAIRVGGSVACISGCALHGLWRPRDDRLHVSVRPGARHLKDVTGAPLVDRGGVVIHWTGVDAAAATRPVLPVLDCLRQAFSCQPDDIAFALVESALRHRALTPSQRWVLAESVSRRQAVMLRDARGNADSGTESVFRFRMGRVGVTMRSQVWIPGVGAVDFLIGDRLVIELDSQEHHGDRDQRRRDLQRDAIAAGLGFRTLRFDYWQVFSDWGTVQAVVLASLARGEHLT